MIGVLPPTIADVSEAPAPVMEIEAVSEAVIGTIAHPATSNVSVVAKSLSLEFNVQSKPVRTREKVMAVTAATPAVIVAPATKI